MKGGFIEPTMHFVLMFKLDWLNFELMLKPLRGADEQGEQDR
jgi:hypothetical protein